MVALPPSGGGHVEVWAPTLQSAIGVSAKSIRLSWYYSLSPSNKFKFERTNLTYGTTTEFEIAVPAITHNYTFDDDDSGIGLGLPCRKWSKARVRIGPLLKGEFDAASEIYAGTDHRQAASSCGPCVFE
jgi:hypothetical protein